MFASFAVCCFFVNAGHFPPPSPLRAHQAATQSRTPMLTSPSAWLDTSKIIFNGGPVLIVQPALLGAGSSRSTPTSSTGPAPSRTSSSASAQRVTASVVRARSAGTRRSSKSSNISSEQQLAAHAEKLLRKPKGMASSTSTHMAGSISRVLLRQQAHDSHAGHTHADGAECDCVFSSRADSALKNFLDRLGPV